MREIKVGHVYRHFKHKDYLVLGIVNDCESNNEDVYSKIVIYKALYGEQLVWARPYEMFASEVDREKYPDVKQQYRFEEIAVDPVMINSIENYLRVHNDAIEMMATGLSQKITK